MILRSKGSRCSRAQYRARISVANTDRAVLEDVQLTYGGMLMNQPPSKARWSHAFQLVWTDGMVEPILLLMLPYLRVKRRQAHVMMTFIRHKKRTRQGREGRYFAPFPDKVIAYREDLHRRIRALNAKGVQLAGGQKAGGRHLFRRLWNPQESSRLSPRPPQEARHGR